MNVNIHDFCRCERGVIAILFAVLMIPISIVAGLAIDFARVESARVALQAATDAAALSGANSSSNRQTIAKSIFEANLANSAFATKAVAVVDVSDNAVFVSSAFSVPTTLSRLAGYKSFDLNVSSIAKVSKAFGVAVRPCIIALSEDAQGAFYVNGTTNFEAIDCAVYSNSAHAESIRAIGAPTVTSSGFCTVGDFDISSNFLPQPIVDCPAMPDPLEKLAPPKMDDCEGDERALSLKKGRHILEPGTFCGGLELAAQSDVTFSPGVYVIRNGSLVFHSGSDSTGSGVVFYLTGSRTVLKVGGGSNIDIIAPASGPYGGLVAIQDKAANPGATSIIRGGGSVKLVGSLYFPTQTIEIGGNGDLGQEVGSWAIIADQVHLTGNGSVQIQAAFEDAGLPIIATAPSSSGPSLLK